MADFLIESPGGEAVEDTLIKLYKTLSVMFSNLDSQNIKSLETGKTKISSGDGLTEIDGARLIMRDKNGRERLQMGSDKSGNFVFVLKNALGNDSLSLSSEGNAVFSGDIKTQNSAEIGNTLYIGKNDTDEGQKLIQFYDSSQSDTDGVKILVTKDEDGVASLRIVADNIVISTLNGFIDAAGNGYVVNDGKMHVEIDGTKYPVKIL